MSEAVKLSQLLPDRLDNVGEQTRQVICENEDISRMSLAWNYVGSQLEGALRTALDCDAIGVFGKCWSTMALLGEYADPEKHPAGERAVVELGAHELGRELHPVIAVTIGECPCVELKFTFAVTGHFGGVKLTVGDGHILSGATGEAWASAQLSLGGIPLHEPAESRRLALPGEFAFAAPGVPIPRIG